ncbi:MAG: DUF3108 domain-containing protein [Candidatus Saelkia tenebricola]|nr:DUF3108 domain-containing protein [Candidatus Saelkia tenebricola]
MKKAIIFFVLLNLSCASQFRKNPNLYMDEWQEKKIDVNQSSIGDFEKERYIYNIKWLGLTVGDVELQNLGIEEHRHSQCYHIVVKARSNKILRYLFRVEDEFHSYIDAQIFRPVTFTAERREGSYRAHSETFFDYDNGKIIYRSVLDGSVKEVELKEELYDAVSCFYKFRITDLKDSNYFFQIVHRAKIWNVDITVIKKGILEMRKHGVLDTFLVNVKAHSDKEKSRGEAWLWFSADNKKELLLAQFKVDIPLVGGITVVSP